MSEKVLLGRKATIERDTTPGATATWAAITVVRDVSRNAERAEVEATTRGDGDEWVGVVAHKKRSIEFELRAHTTDAGYLALHNAFEDGSSIHCRVMNGPIDVDGTKGVSRDWKVSSWQESQPLEGIVTVQVKLMPAADGTHDVEIHTGEAP